MIEEHGGEQGNPRYWMMALSGYLLAPYTTTLFLDSDAYPCPGFGGFFTIPSPYSEKLFNFQSLKTVDFAANADQYPFANDEDWTPGDPEILTDFKDFVEPNTGTVLFHFHRPLVHTFAHFVPLVADHIYKNEASPSKKVAHDQVPFRVALYLFKRLAPEFHDVQLPIHSSCRTYPGFSYSGIDGLLNGMIPTINGEPCFECTCSPCMVSHGFKLTINGSMGWEESIN